jgi:hypothetical protein
LHLLKEYAFVQKWFFMNINSDYKLEISRSAVTEWDDFIFTGKAEPLHLYHTTSWAGRIVELLKFEAIYFVLIRDGIPCFALIGFIDKGINLIPREYAKNILRLIRRIAYKFSIFRRPVSWFGQPIRFVDTDTTDYSQLGKKLQDYFDANHLMLGRGEWPIEQSAALPDKWIPKQWATYKINLQQNLDEIFQTFRSSAKKEIRKARTRGVTLRQVENLEELEEYYDFAKDCAKRYKKNLMGFDDFRTMWVYLRRGGHFETFVARYEGKIIAGLSVWADKYNSIEIGSFQSEDCYRLKLGGADAVKWAAIQWAKSAGLKQFDLAGVNPSPSDPKEAGIRSFKEKWSSDLHKYLIIKGK